MSETKEDVTNALSSIDLNSEKISGCGLCGKTGEKVTKKCSKSHSRCKGILFCDKNCEGQWHKAEKEKKAEEEASKKEDLKEDEENKEALAKEMKAAAQAEKVAKKKAKKAAAKKDGRNKSDGQFWWNNSVYASW